MSKRISIIGLGWLGEALATKLYQAGHEIIGSTTSIDKLLLLARHPFIQDVSSSIAMKL